MGKLKNYRHTKLACYFGYVSQAIVNNFAPLLFLIFRKQFGLSMAQVTALVTVNFGIQLTVDLISAKIADRLGYRACLVAAQFFAAAGLAGLAVFPAVLPDAFAGLVGSAALYALGGGLIEVLISPTIEACPSENKVAQLSFLHSFYCWGTAVVIFVSTGLLMLFGEELWWALALVWAVIPFCNGFYFLFVPFPPLNAEGESLPVRKLCRLGRFWLYALLIALAGAAELAMSQWASAFVESGLNVSKAVGDLTGPCLFAVLMGVARVLYSRFGKRLRTFLILSGVLCIGCYLLAWLSPLPALSLVGCAACGFAVGILWPGIFSAAAEEIPHGGTALFALLALAGDAGCMMGPTLVGLCAEAFGDNLGAGLAIALIFPVSFVVLLSVSAAGKRPKNRP